MKMSTKPFAMIAMALLGACAAPSPADDGSIGDCGATVAVDEGPVSEGTGGSVDPQPNANATDGDTVAWTTGDGSVHAKTGGTTHLVALAANNGLVVRQGRAYYGGYEAVFSAPLAGGNATKIADISNVNALAVDDDALYVLSSVDTSMPGHPGTVTAQIARIASDGVPHTLATQLDVLVESRQPFALDANDVYVVVGVAAENGQPPTGGVVRVAKTGGPAQLIAQVAARPLAIAVDGESIYLSVPAEPLGGPASSVTGTIVAISKATGEAKEIATGSGFFTTIALDGSHLYTARSRGMPSDGVLLRMSLDGTDVTKLAGDNAAGYGQVALSANNVFWLRNWDSTASPDDRSIVLQRCK